LSFAGQKTSACNLATRRTVFAIWESVFNGKWLHPSVAIGRVAE
jgi:hypothetical protein